MVAHPSSMIAVTGRYSVWLDLSLVFPHQNCRRNYAHIYTPRCSDTSREETFGCGSRRKPFTARDLIRMLRTSWQWNALQIPSECIVPFHLAACSPCANANMDIAIDTHLDTLFLCCRKCSGSSQDRNCSNPFSNLAVHYHNYILNACQGILHAELVISQIVNL
jgi:hypothetical protein